MSITDRDDVPFVVLDTIRHGYVKHLDIDSDSYEIIGNPDRAEIFLGVYWRKVFTKTHLVLIDAPLVPESQFSHATTAYPFLLAVAQSIVGACKSGRASRHQYADGHGGLSGCSLSLQEIDAARHALAVANGDSYMLEPLGPHTLD